MRTDADGDAVPRQLLETRPCHPRRHSRLVRQKQEVVRHVHEKWLEVALAAVICAARHVCSPTTRALPVPCCVVY